MGGWGVADGGGRRRRRRPEAARASQAPSRPREKKKGRGLNHIHPPKTKTNSTDIERILGPKASCISFRDSACRCFGFLVSRRRYVYTIDDDCFVARDPRGLPVDALAQHLRNLLSPSTPYFFNTLYDPYRSGSDFVRGYPFSLRSGRPTAVSHGLWLDVPDYDAPTQLAKPLERNATYVDAVLTIPRGSLYPMCGMNLAFDRELVGPAMWFGLQGEGQPLGRYDDMWAGWCSKVVCDHLGYGCKTGLPYVSHSKASDPFVNLRKEYKGIFWQEELVPFFQRLSPPPELGDAAAVYLWIADRVEEELVSLDADYFTRVAAGMRTWIAAWREINEPAEGGVEAKAAAAAAVAGGAEAATNKASAAKAPAAAAAAASVAAAPKGSALAALSRMRIGSLAPPPASARAPAASTEAAAKAVAAAAAGAPLGERLHLIASALGVPPPSSASSS